MSNLQIANTILEQLGGNRFRAMTGATNFIGGENYLQMKLKPNNSKANLLKITLTPSDDYTLEFLRFRNLDVKPVKTIEGIYCDQLQETFTRETGLLTRL